MLVVVGTTSRRNWNEFEIISSEDTKGQIGETKEVEAFS